MKGQHKLNNTTLRELRNPVQRARSIERLSYRLSAKLLVCHGVLAVCQSVMYDELKARPGFNIQKNRPVRSRSIPLDLWNGAEAK